MPGPSWERSNNPLLSGLFGTLQTSAAGRLSTEGTWAALRRAAGTWAWQTAGRGELPDNATLEANGAEVLSRQGVGIQEVNRYRAMANQWRTAKERLHASGPQDQIRGEGIFQPPWAQTTDSAEPARYRVRVQWEVTPMSGDPFHTWGAYEVSSPLTSLQDLLDQAGALVGKKPTSATPLGATVTGVNDYELEQI